MAVGLIASALSRALGQLGDPRFRRVLLLGIGLTIAALIAATAGLMWVLKWLVGDSVTLPFIGPVSWLGDAASVSGLLVMMVASVFLMIPVASAITGMFLEEVADAVEEVHYPEVPKVDGVPFLESLVDAIGFTGVVIAANLVALAFYLLLAPIAPFLFWGINGFLLGREYFTLAAMRRIGREGARKMRRRHAGMIWAAGILLAIPLSIPILNLVIPIIGAAAFTHIFHGLDRRDAGRV